MSAPEERKCLACGEPLVRRSNEFGYHWRKRQTCGGKCAARLIGEKLSNRPAFEQIHWPAATEPATLPSWAFADNVAPRDFGTAPMRPATVVLTKSGVASG